MKNIHILPTDKPSRLFDDGIELYLGELKDRKGHPVTSYNIYITSDEEIKEGDWFIQVNTKKRIKHHSKNGLLLQPQSFDKKIILTTDQELINCFCKCCGVQPIDDEFLEWFVKNPSCEEIEVKPLLSNNGRALFGYKIIIPKEEHISEEAKQRAKNYMSLKGALEPKQIKCYCGHTTYCDCGPLEEPKQKNRKVCKCKRAYENPLSEICGLCWNELYPNEKDEIKDEDLLEPKQETHICKWCKAETWQSDDECYAKPEALEEATEYYAHNYFEMHETNNYKTLKQGFEAGAKWQQEQDNKELGMWKLAVEKQEARCKALNSVISDLQERMYSEEDLKEAFKSCYTPFSFDRIGDLDQDFNIWLEQFKKK